MEFVAACRASEEDLGTLPGFMLLRRVYVGGRRRDE
jgi:hypothetical protein